MKVLKITAHRVVILKTRRGVFYFTLLILTLLYFAFDAGNFSVTNCQALSQQIESKALLYALCFLIMLFCALTPAPAEMVALGNALIFVPVEAFLVTWVSAVVSAIIGYELGRLNGHASKASMNSKKIYSWLQQNQTVNLAVMRLLPIIPFFALNLGCGVMKIDRSKYVVITSITIAPAIALFSFLPEAMR